jgi:flavin reductase (DIM6/NTAB) family NADH-FMN oxidoreductase RutF
MMLDLRQLHGVLDRLNTTGCVITTAFEGRRDGCFVSFVTQCSMHPPRLLALTSHENLTHELIERSGILALHPVGRGQEDWMELFGEQSGREVDKLAQVAWTPGVTGAPLLDGALGYVEGRVLGSMDCGDHTARLVEPVAAALRDPNAVPLTVFELFARGLLHPSARLGNPWDKAVGSRE